MAAGVPIDFQVIAAITGQDITFIAGSAQAQAMGKLLVTDALTGLYNRRYLQQRLALELLARQGGRGKISLCMLDLNDFKRINDTQGHASGDRVLAEVGRAIRRRVPPGSFGTRYGGDEFIIVFPGTGQAAAAAIVAGLQAQLAATAPGPGEPMPGPPGVFVSAGLATWPDDADDYTGLLEAADQAMYRQKLRSRPPAGGAAPPAERQAGDPGRVRPPLLTPDGLPTFLCSQAIGSKLHGAVLAAVVRDQGGFVCGWLPAPGALLAAFASAAAALAAAMDMRQQLLAGLDRREPSDPPALVRVALHTGAAEFHQGTYQGPTIQRCGHLLAAARPGQVIVTAATAARAGVALPAGVTLVDQGSHRLLDLESTEPLYQAVPGDLEDDPPPPLTLDTLPNNLPMQPNAFVGRTAELEQLAALVATERLTVIVGAAGTGKTRLALHSGATHLPEFAGGVWLAELAPLRDPDLIAPALARALGVRADPGAPVLSSVIAHLRDQAALIILDNCEHLGEACAAVVASLLEACAHLRLLITSRFPLGLPGEVDFRLMPLAVPTDSPATAPSAVMEYEAVRLFTVRAGQSRPGFELTPDNTRDVVQICRQLDGIPLALELAAARVKVLAPAEIAHRLVDRFRLLTSPESAVVPRHRTPGLELRVTDRR